ncbi:MULTISPECIES: transglycosylase SLT domain-containing protein [Pseudovibrio]|uniref:lytic transglycosylase domain-containing protein n=1 Tax=Stappiaceae TaxID=2821832 RepID=UPI002366F31C|nr:MULTISPECIES: transglycosylase SLT domain-containing protein [Pseudovibrio]MDD7908356.1 transglycosylase SLT domain-containing protein [Pseudovibrio exalbescens]MDX5592482.1 transglycosylase SLT domain-containing protein [Pseudovibrio sp. SPO723]
MTRVFLASVSTAAFVLAGAATIQTVEASQHYVSQTPAPNPFKQTVSQAQGTTAGSPYVSAYAANGGPRSKPGFGAATSPASEPMALIDRNQIRPQATPQQQLQSQVILQNQQWNVPDATTPATQLDAVLDDIKKGRIEQAINARNRMPDNLDRRIIDWRLMVAGGPRVPTQYITNFAASAPHWPSPKIARARAEASLSASNLPPRDIIAAFGNTQPESMLGKIALAKAQLAVGNNGAARQLIRPIWHKELLEGGLEKDIGTTFARLLTREDYRARVEMFLYRERTNSALRFVSKLSRDEQAYVKARVAQIRGEKNAERLLTNLPRSMRNEAGALYAKISIARSRGDYDTAAKLLQKAPTDADELYDPDAWWNHRRVVSRQMVEAGKPKLAYEIAAEHAAESALEFTEAEWHAGWYALQFLKDPRRAEKHFRKITEVAETPITLSRAYYWMARCKEAEGDRTGAIATYQKAGSYHTAYYGQLALAKLSINQIPVQNVPQISAAERAAFNNNDMVRAIRRMDAAGHHNDTLLLYKHLAEHLPTNTQVRLLAEMAEAKELHQWALMVGKIAYDTRPSASSLAYPTNAIPAKTQIKHGVEKPMVYAIARQESAFNPKAKSHAGALGLLQLMPGTARATARNIGLSYSTSRLTSDPAYNATLGAAHLGELVEEFGGSYILTFAAYNAGKSKVYEWIERFGDPRDPRVDPVDWVEFIPYGETRSYVQRITENLQMYRLKLENKPLAITMDLTRG